MIKNPDYVSYFLQNMKPEDFVTEINREIAVLLCERIQTHRSVEPMALSGELSGEAMDRLSAILASETIQRAERSQLDEYMAILKERSNAKSEQDIAKMDPDEFKHYVDSLTAKKK